MKNIDNIEVYRNLSSSGKDLFKREMVSKTIEKFTPVLHKGSKVAGAYIVLGGRLRVYSIAPNGAEATLYCIDPGETCVIALNCLFQSIDYPAWVETEADTEVAVVSGTAFRSLFRSEASIQDLTVQALSTSVFRLMGELEQLHFFKVEHRLAGLILARAPEDGLLQMTHQELAFHLGTAREVVSRILNLFSQNGYIETSRGVVKLVSREALENMIENNQF